MRSIEILKEHYPVTDPIEVGNPADWTDIQERIGSALPRDYQDFINCYGTVKLYGFLLPFNPYSKNQNLDLVRQMAVQLSALRFIKAQHGTTECPHPLYFEPGGLLPWGVTDNGDVLFWQTVGHPDQWTVVVNESRGPIFERFDGSMTDFVQAFLARALTSDILPDDFGDAPPIAPV